MMRLLIVSFAYWPLESPRAFRWTAVSEQFAREGHQVDVICAWQGGLPRYQEVNGVRLHRPHIGVLDPVSALARRLVGGGATGLPGVRPSGLGRAPGGLSSRLRRKTDALAKWTYDHTWRSVRWPDYACLWIPPALRTARRLTRNGHYDALITVSHPFSGHLVGLALGARAPQRWLVDIGDPWSFSPGYPMNNDRLYRRLNVAVERRVFAMADVVSVTHPGSKHAYATLYPHAAAKIYVVPPVAAPISPEAGSSPFTTAGVTRLAYIGSLYQTIRSPQFLLSLLERLWATSAGERTELHLFGPLNDSEDLITRYQQRHPNRIVVYGKVSPAVARRAMEDADILVNLGNQTAYQLPSKVVEYIAAGRPVLNIAYHEEDSSAALLGDYPAMLNVIESQAASGRDYLPELTAFVQDPPSLDRQTRDWWRRRFGPEAIAAQYLSLASGSV